MENPTKDSILSKLLEPNAEIEELFDRDPLDLSPEEIQAIAKQLIRYFRRERELWNEERKSGKSSRGKSTRKTLSSKTVQAAKIARMDPKITLDDLGFGGKGK